MLFMKKICLLMILQIVTFASIAQKNAPANFKRPEPVNPVKDKQEYQGYTIRLMPALPVPGTMGSYGFDIFKDNKPVVRLFQNPLPSFPKGIQKKEDAYKIAQWMIEEYERTGHWQNMVPPHVARELKIETNSIIQNN
jgi:hypothetical protein